MRWDDLLYGEIEIPEEIWKLFAYPLLVRLRGISQAVLPLEANPFTAQTASGTASASGVWRRP